MPKLKKSTEGEFSAVFAKQVAARTYRGQQIFSTITRPRQSTSVKKKEANDRFAYANRWAKGILLQPGMKELYSKHAKGKFLNAHTVAVADFLNAPKIDKFNLTKHTGAIGDKIRVQTTNSFKVIALSVAIIDKYGRELEKGPAVQDPLKRVTWVYTLMVANPDVVGTVIEVTAIDRPGNTTKQRLTIDVPFGKVYKLIKKAPKK